MDLEIYTDNRLLLLFGDGVIHGDVYSTTTIADTDRHHVAVVRNHATQTVQFFIDGTAESVKNYANPLGDIVPLGNESLLIGRM